MTTDAATAEPAEFEQPWPFSAALYRLSIPSWKWIPWTTDYASCDTATVFSATPKSILSVSAAAPTNVFVSTAAAAAAATATTAAATAASAAFVRRTISPAFSSFRR